MLYGMYVSAAGALANSYRQEVVSNNLANVETVAFKRDLALLQCRRTQAQQTGQNRYTTADLEGIGGGLFAQRTFTDFTPAALEHTDNRFDLALSGKGFFQVLKGNQIQYTRDGKFTLDEHNRLVTISENLPVLDDQGKEIVLDPTQPLLISEAGVIDQNGIQIGVVNFADTGLLRKEGDNLYRAPDGAQAQPVNTVVKQGFLEDSNVNALDQLTTMIQAQRLFQTNISLLQMQDETLNSAVNKLGNIS